MFLISSRVFIALSMVPSRSCERSEPLCPLCPLCSCIAGITRCRRPDAADRVSTTLLDKINPQPTHVPELVVATRQARLALDADHLAEDAAQHPVDELRSRAGIGVRAADRLRDDFV